MSNVSNLKSLKKLKPNQFLLDGHLITEHPILFSTEMVKANLEGRKTMTRRVIKPQPECVNNVLPIPMDEFRGKMEDLLKKGLKTIRNNTGGFAFPDCKFGKPGDLLYVRETWTEWPKGDYQYKASTAFGNELGTWKPSIHLPKAGSRIWAMIEDIRVERLHEISEEDAKAEGIECIDDVCGNGPAYCDYHPVNRHDYFEWFSNPIDSFETLWISINREESWKSNPWVWVVKYRILSKTGRPSMGVIGKNYLEVTNPPSPLKKGEFEQCLPKAEQPDHSQPITDQIHV